MDQENGGLVKFEFEKVEHLVREISVPQTQSEQTVCRKRKADKSAENETLRIAWKIQEKLLENEEFQPWLEKVQGDTSKVYCVWCKVNIHAKMHAIRRHMGTKKHKLIVDQRNNVTQRLGEPSSSRSPIKEEAEAGKECIINLLRGYLHPDEDSEVRSHGGKENKISMSVNFTEMIKEQLERKKLMSALINIQRDKLLCEQKQLFEAKKRMHAEQKILDILKTKLYANLA